MRRALMRFIMTSPVSRRASSKEVRIRQQDSGRVKSRILKKNLKERDLQLIKQFRRITMSDHINGIRESIESVERGRTTTRQGSVIREFQRSPAPSPSSGRRIERPDCVTSIRSPSDAASSQDTNVLPNGTPHESPSEGTDGDAAEDMNEDSEVTPPRATNGSIKEADAIIPATNGDFATEERDSSASQNNQEEHSSSSEGEPFIAQFLSSTSDNSQAQQSGKEGSIETPRINSAYRRTSQGE